MGKRGPIPKPTALKVAAGNPGKRRLNEGEPVPPAGPIVPPSWLAEPSRQIWDQLAPIVMGMKTLTSADVFAFSRYCNCIARYVELDKFLMRKGASGTTYKVMDGNGKFRSIREIPQAIEYRRLHEILVRLESHFGLTPAARSRINVEPGAKPAHAGQTLNPADQAKQNFFRRGGPEAPRPIPGAAAG